jgi:hypothetical protein
VLLTIFLPHTSCTTRSIHSPKRYKSRGFGERGPSTSLRLPWKLQGEHQLRNTGFDGTYTNIAFHVNSRKSQKRTRYDQN